jgi:hypothetical protein
VTAPAQQVAVYYQDAVDPQIIARTGAPSILLSSSAGLTLP